MNTRTRLLIHWFKILLISTITPSFAWGQNQLNMDLVAHWPEGSVEDLQIVGQTLYYTDGAQLVISDISDPNQPIEQGSYTTQVNILAFLLEGHYAYLVDGLETLHILDISKGDQPQLLQRVSFSGDDVTDIEKLADYIYLAHREGLTIVDVSDVVDPHVVNHTFEDFWFQDLYIDSVIMFATDRPYGLRVFNLDNPAQPMSIGSFKIDKSSYSIDKKGDYLFVTDDSEGTIIIDISSPGTPTMIQKISGARIHSAVIVDSLLYCAGVLGLDIYNVIDPTQPERLSAAAWGFGIDKIRWSGDHIFASTYDQDLYIINVEDVRNPGIATSLSTGGITRDIYVQDQLVYVANSRYGLRIMDISKVAAPVELSLTNTGDLAEQVLVRDQIAYIANYFSGIMTVDVSAPNNPVILDQFDPGWTEDLDLKDDYIVMADRSAGLVIMDVSDPANLSQLSSMDIASNVIGLDVDGNFAYVAAHSAGLFIIDISNPLMPIEVGHLEGNIWEVIVVGQYAYLADYTNGFRIVDISNPALPVELGRILLAGAAADLTVNGNYAYVSTLKAGVRMIDIQDPANPVEYGYFQSVANTPKISASEEHIFLYESNGGVYVLQGKESTTSIDLQHVDGLNFTCFPNPFSAFTQFRLKLKSPRRVDVRIFDTTGKLIHILCAGELSEGDHLLGWDGRDAGGNNVPEGVYYYELKTDVGTTIHKLVRN